MTFTPDAIRKLRKALGLTQESFAAELGVHVSNVSRWEGGCSTPSRWSQHRLGEIAATALAAQEGTP